jgi:hypothetical protein
MSNDDLKLRFDPGTIEHLGIKMYSQLPYALAELIANAYDAAADSVEIFLYDEDSQNMRIVIKDDGEGMSYGDVRDRFLVIGRKRRDDDDKRENSKQRRITGRKGLGKLALFGIGKNIRIETAISTESNKTVFSLDWDGIINERSGEYTLDTTIEDKGDFSHGTIITLSRLSRVSAFDLKSIAMSLSKMFNFIDSSFAVTISKNDNRDHVINLSRELRVEGIEEQFRWELPSIVASLDDIYEYKHDLKGVIISSLKPMRQDLRGISLYANGRLVNLAGYFGLSEAGHTFTYITGWIDADFLDESDEDFIATDRQSLHWDLPETEALQSYLRKIVRFLVYDWSEKRKTAKREQQTERSGVNFDEWIPAVPEGIRNTLNDVINSVGDDPSIDNDEFANVVKSLYELIPPFTYYHYRYLHNAIQDASRAKYQNCDFYGALYEACKRYVDNIKLKVQEVSPDDFSSLPPEDRNLMGRVFGQSADKILKFMSDATQTNGLPFTSDTKGSLEDSQMLLSQGVITGYRNPISHTEHAELSETGVISEQHCLDALSLLTLLFERLEKSKKTPSP